jgi:hypothetical protein
VTGEIVRVVDGKIDLRPVSRALGESLRVVPDADGVTEIRYLPDGSDSAGCDELLNAVPSLRGRLTCLAPARPTAAAQDRFSPASPADAASGEQAPAGVPPRPGGTSPVTSWTLGLNSIPSESIAQGTQSSQSFGALLSDDVYFGDANHLNITVTGSHVHTLSLHKPGIFTDTFDATPQFSRTLGAYKVYWTGEWFLNTSLGMAAERNGGMGVQFPVLRSHNNNFSATFRADLRYYNERLYSPTSLDLIGSRLHQEFHYRSSDKKWSWSIVMNEIPMYNNKSAWQAAGSAVFSFPLGQHVCIDLTPADDYYIDNSPKGFRRNYLKSTIGLRLLLGSNPADQCQ